MNLKIVIAIILLAVAGVVGVSSFKRTMTPYIGFAEARTASGLVQVNGKLKAVLKVPAEIDDAALEAAALADAKVQEAVAGRAIKKTIVKSKKLVTLVVG